MGEQHSNKENADNNKRFDQENSALTKDDAILKKHMKREKDPSDTDSLLHDLDAREEAIDKKPEEPVKGPTDIESLLSSLNAREEAIDKKPEEPKKGPTDIESLLQQLDTEEAMSLSETVDERKEASEATRPISAAALKSAAKESEPVKKPAQVHVTKRVEQSSPKRDEPKKKFNKKMLLILLLIFIIAGVGVFALVHFVIMPGLKAEEPLPTEEPTVAAVATPDSTADTAAPTEAASETEYERMANVKLNNMTQREKICQLFIVTPEVLLATDESVTIVDDSVKSALEEYPVSGILFSSKNLTGEDQAKTLISDTQSAAKTAMFLTVGEGGKEQGAQGAQQGGPEGAPQGGPEGAGPDGGGPEGGPGQGGPGQGDSGEQREDDPEAVYESTKTVAQEKSAIGFNLDLSVSADTQSDDADYAKIGELVSSAVKAYDENNIITAVKSFPCSSENEEGSDSFATTTRSADELKKNELTPFKTAIDKGASMITVGHVIVEEIDKDKPATLSGKVVPTLLREELGYNGVVITDGMDLGSMTDKYSYNEIVKGVFDADIDMILNPDNLKEYVTATEKALDDGSIKEEQLDAKVKKILALKYEKGLLSNESTDSTENN